MGHLITLAAASLIGMSGIPASAFGVAYNIETSERGYFEIDTLPELSEIRNTEKQIRMCFEAYKSDVWEALFD